jgi:hypothetical protein
LVTPSRGRAGISPELSSCKTPFAAFAARASAACTPVPKPPPVTGPVTPLVGEHKLVARVDDVHDLRLALHELKNARRCGSP